MISEQLQIKVNRAIKLLKLAEPKDGSPIEVAYSGGKDSDIILQLVKESGIKYRAIYKMTTIDPPGTLSHVKAMGVEVIRPKRTFADIMAHNGMPNQYRRFCCKYLKEYKVLDKAVVGVRKEESIKRAQRYKEPTQCRVYTKTQRVEQILPILDWTLADIVEYAEDRKLTFAPIYYDEKGVFHPERRLGCLCCPLMSKNKRIEQFKQYKGMIKFYLRNLQKYMDTHPNVALTKENGDVYTAFARNVLVDNYQKWQEMNEPNLFGMSYDWKSIIEKLFNVVL